MFKTLQTSFIALMLLQSAAAAEALVVTPTPAPKFVDEGWKSVRRVETVRLDADGLGVDTYEFEWKATSRAGVEAIANENYGYDPNFETLTLEGLETVKADGRIVPVDPRAVHDQAAPVDTQSPYIDDRREKIVAFPDVEPGDFIRGRTVTRRIKAQLGRGYTNTWTQRADMSDEDFQVVIDAPVELALRVSAKGLKDEIRTEDGRVIHSFVFPKSPQHVLTEATASFDVGPRIEASTFETYGDFARTVADLNAGAATADAAIKAEVAALVAGATEPREKAKRISDWVAEHIRYVGIGLGNGGFVSEPASATFAARFGDCKAHATLLKAMLAEVGVDADLVLIGSAGGYETPTLAVNVFDHMIVYLPGMDLYLDPTDAFGVFGAPLIELAGKPGLDLTTGQLRSLPLATPDDLKLGVETHMQMNAEGFRSGESVFTGERNGEAYRRYETTTFCDCGEPRKTLEALLASHHYQGSGDYVFPDAHKLSEPFVLKAHFAEDKAWDIHRFGAAIWVDTPVDPSVSMIYLTHQGIVGRAAACTPLDLTETNTFKLPDGVDVLEINDPLSIEDAVSGRTALGPVDAHISVQAAFSLDGRMITQTNHFRVAFTAAVCTPEIVDHVDAAVKRLRGYRYTWVPLSTGAWYRPQNWLSTMTKAAAAQ